jgi:hypothetical protein
MLATKRGNAWWMRAKQFGFLLGFVADVDKRLIHGNLLPPVFGSAGSPGAGGASAITPPNT